MISESATCRKMLWDIGESLTRRRSQKRWSERSILLVERDCFVSGFLSRKLRESTKIPDSTWKLQLPAIKYPRTGSFLDRMNCWKFDEHYQLDQPQTTRLKYEKLCNWLVHSYVFAIHQEDNGGLGGIFVNSDHSRNDGLWYLKLHVLTRAIQRVASDYVIKSYGKRKPPNDEFDLKLFGQWDAAERSGLATWSWSTEDPVEAPDLTR